jgi:hypothetical protein
MQLIHGKLCPMIVIIRLDRINQRLCPDSSIKPGVEIYWNRIYLGVRPKRTRMSENIMSDIAGTPE